jgi:hypothetical protein
MFFFDTVPMAIENTDLFAARFLDTDVTDDTDGFAVRFFDTVQMAIGNTDGRQSEGQINTTYTNS